MKILLATLAVIGLNAIPLTQSQIETPHDLQPALGIQAYQPAYGNLQPQRNNLQPQASETLQGSSYRLQGN